MLTRSPMEGGVEATKRWLGPQLLLSSGVSVLIRASFAANVYSCHG